LASAAPDVASAVSVPNDFLRLNTYPERLLERRLQMLASIIRTDPLYVVFSLPPHAANFLSRVVAVPFMSELPVFAFNLDEAVVRPFLAATPTGQVMLTASVSIPSLT
jgi:hypothetical protein